MLERFVFIKTELSRTGRLRRSVSHQIIDGLQRSDGDLEKTENTHSIIIIMILVYFD